MSNDKLITVIDNSVKKELSNLEIPTSLKNESSIDKTPKTDSSQVHTDRLRCLKRSVTFSFRCLYLFILKDLEDSRFVSWQIVSSSTTILLFVTTARSGLKLENKSCCCKKLEYGRSTYNLCVLEIRSFIHLANNPKTLLCLSVYLDKAALLPQFDNTCLFVWIFEHRGHLSSTDLPHLFKLASVGSWDCNAFHVKLKR